MAAIEPTLRPTATDLADGLSLVDGICYSGGRRATPLDSPVRNDLPQDHPLYDSRALRCVPAGMPDMVIGVDGRLEPALESVEEPIEPTPGPLEPIEVNRG